MSRAEEATAPRWGRIASSTWRVSEGADAVPPTALAAACRALSAGACAVRFAGGSTDAGTLEVYHDGRWGTVCAHDAKALGVAHVACRQLGFGLATGTMLMPGGETAARWLSSVACDGTEVGIGGCGHAGWGAADTCDGALGVRCLACEGEQCDAYAAAVRLCDLQLTSHLPTRARTK